MPVSRKRRKKSDAAPTKLADARIALPDPRVMEGVMSRMSLREARGALDEAQSMMYEAWGAPTRRTRIACAHKALAISPQCADAYVLLAQEEAITLEDKLTLWRTGVEAGEKALGSKGFKEYAGHFWGFLETRPYMRARAGLATALNASGDTAGAIGHYEGMLELNPNDNQGIRYLLAECLMKQRDIQGLKDLFDLFDEDASAAWLYSRALIAFLEGGASDPRADAFAKNALRANAHVPAVLNDPKNAKPSKNGYLTMGGEDEAADYVESWGFEWVTTPGAVAWLTQLVAQHTPQRRLIAH
jgi:tetratricopeptide (TPR) repeat protein